jgi:hypothetical protein
MTRKQLRQFMFDYALWLILGALVGMGAIWLIYRLAASFLLFMAARD